MRMRLLLPGAIALAGCTQIFGVGDLTYGDPGPGSGGAATSGTASSSVSSSASGGAASSSTAASSSASTGGGGSGGDGGSGGAFTPTCMNDGDCEDGDTCTIDSCVNGMCEQVDETGTCGLTYRGRQVFQPFPATGGDFLVDIGPAHPRREIWCLVAARGTTQFTSLGPGDVTIGGQALSNHALSPPGLDVGQPSTFSGWFGRFSFYRLPFDKQVDAGIDGATSATINLQTTDQADTLFLFAYTFVTPLGKVYQGLEGSHITDADNVVNRTVAASVYDSDSINPILASTHGSADIVVIAASMSTAGNGARTMMSSSPYEGVSITQDSNNGRVGLGSAWLHDVVPTPSGGTWSSITGFHNEANGVAMHLITAAYW